MRREPFGNPLEPLGVGLKMCYELPAQRTRILAQVINPTREAHERRPELVGRLAGHRHPQPVARRVDALAHRPRGEEHETREYDSLEQRETGQRPRGGQRAVMDRPDARLDQRLMHLIELRDPRVPRRVAHVGAIPKWGIVQGGDAARGVGDGDRDAEAAHLLREHEQRVGGGALARVVQSGEHMPEEPAGLARVVAQVARDDPRVADGQRPEQQGRTHEGRGPRPSEHAPSQCAPRRHMAPVRAAT